MSPSFSLWLIEDLCIGVFFVWLGLGFFYFNYVSGLFCISVVLVFFFSPGTSEFQSGSCLKDDGFILPSFLLWKGKVWNIFQEAVNHRRWEVSAPLITATSCNLPCAAVLQGKELVVKSLYKREKRRHSQRRKIAGSLLASKVKHSFWKGVEIDDSRACAEGNFSIEIIFSQFFFHCFARLFTLYSSCTFIMILLDIILHNQTWCVYSPLGVLLPFRCLWYFQKIKIRCV